MTVAQLIDLLEKVDSQTLYVYMQTTDNYTQPLGHVVIQKDLQDNETIVLLKIEE